MNGLIGIASWDAVARLVAREAVGRTGTAASLGLVRWADLGQAIGGELLHRTLPAERIDVRLDLTPEEQRRGILRTAMRLPANRFPRVIPTAVSSLPRIILHEGLARKLGANSDADHYRFAKQTVRSVQSPFEVWKDVDGHGKPVVRFLNRYGAPVNGYPGVANHLVVMEEETGIAITQYVRRDAQMVADRKGTLLLAGWAAPST